MKKQFLKAASATAAFVLLCTQAMPSATIFAEEEVTTSGKCGVDLNWEFVDGTLTISGSSSNFYMMYEQSHTDMYYPWHHLRSEITSVVFDENCGIEEIPWYSFYECENLTSVTLSPKIEYIANRAFWKTNIREVTIPTSMIYIGSKNFADDECTVYGVANSAASNYCTDYENRTFVAIDDGELQEMNLVTDTWSFENSADDFQETAALEWGGTYLTPDHLEAFTNNATSTDYKYMETMLKYSWAGSCLGMSSLLTLCRNGVLSPSDIQAGAETVNDIQMNSEVESIMNYYALMLNGYSFSNLTNVGDMMTEEERVQILMDYGKQAHDEGTSFLVVLYGGHNGGHALVGVDMIEGEWILGDKTYDACIELLDPNYANKATMGSCIYVNQETGEWVQPTRWAGNGDNIWTGRVYCTDSIEIMNFHGLLSGADEYDADIPKVARMYYSGFEAQNTVLEVMDANNNVFSRLETGVEDINADVDHAMIYPTDESITLHRIVEQEPDRFTEPTGVMEEISGYDYLYIVQGDGPEYVHISPDAISYTIDEWTAQQHKKYSVDHQKMLLHMVYNTDRFSGNFDWDYLVVKTNDTITKDGSVTQVENGYVLSGDMLRKATVALCHAKTGETLYLDLHTAEPSVLITCDENNNPILLADANRDGTYETLMDEAFQETEPITYDIAFASYILNYYASSSAGLDVSNWYTEGCDVNEDGSIDIADSAYVLQKYAEDAAGLN